MRAGGFVAGVSWLPDVLDVPAKMVRQAMVRSTQDIAADIAAFQPRDGNWIKLDALLSELWKDGTPQSAILEMFRVFERFPEEDGNGVFWAIIHGIETLTGYEPQLVASLRRAPSEMGVTMLGRLLNAGCQDIDGISIRDVLAEVAVHSDAGLQTRKSAASFLNYAAQQTL